MTFETVHIGDATLIHGDCMEVLPTLGKFDAVITDPPYGIDVNTIAKNAFRRNKSLGNAAVDYGDIDWDMEPPNKNEFDAIRSMAKWCALFGGNYFELPPTSCWLVWDKVNGANNFADCELAWTNWPIAVRMIKWQWCGAARPGKEAREHPTQKPLEVMKWVIELCPKAQTILDPFMGSGTTGVAAVQLGRKFTGIERERKYFDIACERIARAQAQGKLFEPEQPKQTQEALI